MHARTAICLAALIASASVCAQTNLTILSLDEFRTDRISGENRHEILPVAVFDGAQFRPVGEPGGSAEANVRRNELLAANPEVHVLFRGRRIGTVAVSERYVQNYSCSELTVGSGQLAPDVDLPESEVTGAVRGSNNGRSFDYVIRAYIALGGSIDVTRLDGEALVAAVTDPAELERYASDVASIEPRANLLPLGEDETRAYRLDRYGAVVVVRKRRSAAMIQGPAGLEFISSLMTDIVVVRTNGGERLVHPLYRSTLGMDAMGQGGPTDTFIDAFELETGTAYLAFERRGYESHSLLLYRLESEGGVTLVFEDGLYGC